MSVKQTPRGATTSTVTFKQRFNNYRDHHRAIAKDSLQRLLATPIPTLMTVLVIAISLSLPAGLYLFLKNIQSISGQWGGQAQVSLFVRPQVNSEQAQQLAKFVGERADVSHTKFISREEALAEFKAQTELGDLLAGLDENPLPAVVVVYPKNTDLAAVELLRAELAKLGAVEFAQMDAQWVQRLQAMVALGEHLVLALSLGLAFAVLLVIINTVRLSIEARRDEIVIVKLVGGTDAFVRRPFMYTGLWYGLAGCIAAFVIVEALLLWVRGPVKLLSELYASEFKLQGLGFDLFGLMLLGSVTVGLVGAHLAVGFHLRKQNNV